MESNLDTKIHVGINVNRKKIPRIRVTNFIIKKDIVKSLEFTIYKDRKQFGVLKYRPNSKEVSYAPVFLLLQKLADEEKFNKLEWPANDFIFETCQMHKFIETGNEILTDLHIYITKNAKLVFNDEEKHEIMIKLHVDSSNGQHCGQKKLYAKIKDEFYWRNMTRDIAKFVRNCSLCMQNREN